MAARKRFQNFGSALEGSARVLVSRNGQTQPRKARARQKRKSAGGSGG